MASATARRQVKVQYEHSKLCELLDFNADNNAVVLARTWIKKSPLKRAGNATS